MLHICKAKKQLPKIALKGNPFESVAYVCVCGKVVHSPTSGSKKMQGLRYVAFFLGLVLVGLLYLYFSKKGNLIPSFAESSSSELVDKFQNDPTVSIGGLSKKTYFLNKEPFLSAAKKSNRSLKSIDDFRDVLTNYLVTESLLVQDVFEADTAVLWKYVVDKNPEIIDYVARSIKKIKKVHQLDDWQALVVYHLGDTVLKKKKEQPIISKDTMMLLVEKKHDLAATLPNTYKAMIGKKTEQLRLKDFIKDGNSLKFVYEIIGKAKHYNKNAVLNTKDNHIEMESLGKAALQQNSDGTTSIIIKNGNYNFISIY